MSAHNTISQLSEAVGPDNVGNQQGKCFAWFDGVPPASAAGFAKGCIAINVAATTTTTRIYVNSGTNASATWASITTSA